MSDPINALIGAIMLTLAPAPGAAMDLDIDQVRCMADNIYFEGRNEGMAGQMAIALVTLPI